MIPYVIAGVVALALLYVAYRSFGGEASRPVDSPALLRVVLGAADAAGRGIADVVRDGVTPGDDARGSAGGPLRSARRDLDGCAHQLQVVEVARLRDHEHAAHSLLLVAVDELAWAVRLMGAPGYSAGGGMQGAVDALREHAGTCLSEARRLMGESGAAEEAHGTV